MFPKGMFSCLAGFMEPGETVEEAVRRETFEESGIRVGKIYYHSSQPWPYPSQIMIAMTAEALTEDVVVDTTELEEAKWYTREEVQKGK
jgi:NAD+ diphosphatase